MAISYQKVEKINEMKIPEYSGSNLYVFKGQKIVVDRDEDSVSIYEPGTGFVAFTQPKVRIEIKITPEIEQAFKQGLDQIITGKINK